MEKNFEATESAGIQGMNSSDWAMKRDSDDSETLQEPVFVSVKSEPYSEVTPEETTAEKNFEAPENAEEFFKGNNQQPHFESSALNCVSQLASPSTHSPKLEMEAMNTQKHFSRNSFSAEETVLLQNLEGKRPFAVAANSTAHKAMDQKEAADMLKGLAQEQLAGERQKQYSDRSEGKRSASLQKVIKKQKLPSGSSRSSVDEKRFKCSECGKAFKTKQILRNHMRLHTGERPYKCSQCQNSFTQLSSLNAHMRSHTGHRPYKCSHCGKSFTQSGALSDHMLLHSGEKPFKCTQCGECFTQRGALTKHMRQHTGERPYKCPQCGKLFSQSYSLSVHIRAHSGDRRYRCCKCGKFFLQSSDLTRHMGTHTK